MKRVTTSITLFVALLVCTSGQGFALNIGDSMPMTNRTMKNVSGKDLSLTAAAGKKGTLVIFSCNHCPYVRAWEDRMIDYSKTFIKDGVNVVLINSNDPNKVKGDSFEEMKKRAAAQGYPFPYVVDHGSKMAHAFGATRTPEVFLFNGKGSLVYHGAIDDNHSDRAKVEKHYLKDAVASLVSGKPVPTTSTRAVGCSIKWAKKK